MKVGIVGRAKDTYNYERILKNLQVSCLTSLALGELMSCQALIFPGGGDIDPQLYGAPNKGSVHIDTELDLLQLRAFGQALQSNIPVLGICKGMQLINIGLGGTLTQHLPTHHLHTDSNRDLMHSTIVSKDSFLYELYGSSFPVNSKHHQAVDKPGNRLIPVQWCPKDSCIEAICHSYLPVFGVQWHPERLPSAVSPTDGTTLFQYFLSFV